MYLPQEKVIKIITKYGGSEKNTGSCESQVAILSTRIRHLTNHLKENRKDFVTQRSLVAMVSKRRKLLDYLRRKDTERYAKLIANKELGVKK